jgi:hypothetical protein
MILNNICIILGGILTLLMGIFHCTYYIVFEWGNDFQKISIRNKKIFITIHLALIGYFIIFAVISLFFFKELKNKTPLSISILILVSLFWFIRGVWQIFYFRLTKDLKVKPNRSLHYILTVYFFAVSILYFIPIAI